MIKKEIRMLFLILVSIAIVTACTQQQTTTPITKKPLVNTISDKPEEAVMPEMTQELKDLLAKINTIQSYSFIDHQTKDEYLIRDDKIRINLFQKRGTKELGQYDTVYLDTTNKKAYGICLDKLCDIRLREKYLTPSYDTYKLEQTPVARVKAIQYAELTGRTQQIHNVPTYQIVFTENNITTEMWLHNFYAYPMEIKITKKGIQTNISFDKVTINNINIEEVTLPSSYTPLE